MEYFWQAMCCGGGLGVLVALWLLFKKVTAGISNYTGFELNEYNHPMTWKDRTDYGE